jgi:hypothetical protein
MAIGELLEDVRPWLSTAGILALCEFARRLWVQNRQLRMAENKDDRDGYGVLIAALEQSIKTMEERHMDALKSMRADHSAQLERIAGEHHRCEERLAKIEGELMGFHRQALIQSQSGVAALPASKMVVDAAERAVSAAARAADEKGKSA